MARAAAQEQVSESDSNGEGEQWLTTVQAAVLIGATTTSKLTRLVKAGALQPYARPGRKGHLFKRADVMALQEPQPLPQPLPTTKAQRRPAKRRRG